MLARLAVLLLPVTVALAVPTAAHAAYYCDIYAGDVSGWIYGAGLVTNCVQPVQAELHLREDRSFLPDREVSADIRPGVTYAFLEVGATCLPTPFEDHRYFVEVRVKVGGKYHQKQQSPRWQTQFYCG